jgi:hypothetical protein
MNCSSFILVYIAREANYNSGTARKKRIQVKTKHTISEDWKSIVLG